MAKQASRRRLGALAAFLALVLAACGGGSGGAGGSAPEAARFLPASVPLFAALTTDLESGKW
jgi:hypothetical protein